MNDFNQAHCEAFLDGKWVVFDGQSSGSSLKDAKVFYKNWKYIGTTTKRRYNGIESSETHKSHIFVRK